MVMKVLIIIALWVLGFIMSAFLFMLICRLNGDSPEKVYEFDADNMGIYFSMLLFMPLVLFIELVYLFYRFVKKWLIVGVESIIAYKEIKNEDNNSY